MTITRLDNGDFLIECPLDLRMLHERKSFVQVDEGGVPKNPEEIPVVVRLGRAHRMVELMLSGTYKSRQEVATALGVSSSLVSRAISCAFISPVIVAKALRGEIATSRLIALAEKVNTMPFWADQHKFIGIE